MCSPLVARNFSPQPIEQVPSSLLQARYMGVSERMELGRAPSSRYEWGNPCGERDHRAKVPEGRKRQGSLETMTVRDDISLTALRRITRLGFIRKVQDRELATRFQRELMIHPSNGEMEVRSLSGGNQQKVLIARWLATGPKMLMLDEPTAGVDVGAQAEVHRLIRTTAERGAAVVRVSSDVREVVIGADRVLVLHEGHVIGTVGAERASEERLVGLASGVPLAGAG